MNRGRMARVGFVAILLLLNVVVNGQTFNELFRQKKTQIKYLLEQIAQLQVQIELLKKGYKIVDNGLKTIHQIKDGEFKLHKSFFNSLKSVNPYISKYADVPDIIATQAALINSCDRLISHATESEQFSSSELALFKKSLDNYKEAVKTTLAELIQVTTVNKLELTDDERIVRIQQIKEQSSEQKTSLIKMGGDLEIMVRSRLRDGGEIELLQKLYGK